MPFNILRMFKQGTFQDLESERVASNQLQLDLMMYKQLVEQERARNAELEKRIRTLQDQFDNTQISATVKDVPGVDPAILLEEFSSAFVRLKRECSRLKAAGASNHAGASNRRASSQMEDFAGDDDGWSDAMAHQDDPTSEPGTIRELLFSLPLPQSAHDYEKVLEALGSGMLGQQVWVMEQQLQLFEKKLEERTQQFLTREADVLRERDQLSQELHDVSMFLQKRQRISWFFCRRRKQTHSDDKT